MSPEEAALKEHQREVVLVFLGLLGLGKYFHTLANDLGADNIEDLCNPNVLHPSDLEEPPLNMDPHDAHHLMAATAGAREAKAFLVAEGFEAYISSFIGIGVFRMEQLVDLTAVRLRPPVVGEGVVESVERVWSAGPTWELTAAVNIGH